MKKTLFLLFVSLFVMCISAGVRAASNVDIYINGRYLECDDAYIENGRTMVPARSIFESLGATVGWDGDSRCVTAERGSTRIRMWIGNTTLVTDSGITLMDAAPVIVNDKTYVPARAVSQAFSADVVWVPELYAVNITEGKDTLDMYPAVLLPDISSFDGEEVSFDERNVCYSVTVPDGDDSDIPESIIELVNSYERAMKDIGWTKRVVIDTGALWETEFNANALSHCPYKVTFFVKGTENGRYLVFVSVTDLITVYNTDSGKVRSIAEADFLSLTEYADAGWKKSLNKRVTLYGIDNGIVQVFDYEVHPWKLCGFTEYKKTVTMYSPEGDAEKVGVDMISEYEAVGYTAPSRMTMYSPAGEVVAVNGNDIVERISEGMSVMPFYTVVYSVDGKSITVERHRTDEYLASGWYTEPVVMMYRDGETIVVSVEQIAIYEEAGWSTKIVISAEDDGRSEAIGDYMTVYITPSGKRYHISRECAGSGAVPKTLHEVKDKYGPCGTCTDK